MPKAMYFQEMLGKSYPSLLAFAAVAPLFGSPAASAATIDLFGPRIVLAHNAERAALRLQPLAWSPRLAAGAQAYANELARLGVFRHADPSRRPEQGENLWMGSRGAFGPHQMIAGWLGEKRMFRPGVFPDVATNGNWSSVGHYTQMIWPGTREVGCAVASSARADVLVCRYYPQGNIIGQRVP